MVDIDKRVLELKKEYSLFLGKRFYLGVTVAPTLISLLEAEEDSSSLLHARDIVAVISERDDALDKSDMSIYGSDQYTDVNFSDATLETVLKFYTHEALKNASEIFPTILEAYVISKLPLLSSDTSDILEYVLDGADTDGMNAISTDWGKLGCKYLLNQKDTIAELIQYVNDSDNDVEEINVVVNDDNIEEAVKRAKKYLDESKKDMKKSKKKKSKKKKSKKKHDDIIYDVTVREPRRSSSYSKSSSSSSSSFTTTELIVGAVAVAALGFGAYKAYEYLSDNDDDIIVLDDENIIMLD